jgi:hypothetical protein
MSLCVRSGPVQTRCASSRLSRSSARIALRVAMACRCVVTKFRCGAALRRPALLTVTLGSYRCNSFVLASDIKSWRRAIGSRTPSACAWTRDASRRYRLARDCRDSSSQRTTVRAARPPVAISTKKKRKPEDSMSRGARGVLHDGVSKIDRTAWLQAATLVSAAICLSFAFGKVAQGRSGGEIC